MTSQFDEGWTSPQRILIILAHPDDPEFFMGATIARWTRHGHHVAYCLVTRGDKGSSDPSVLSSDLSAIREDEQFRAAKQLGVTEIRFLDYCDGCLVPSMELRKSIVQIIREYRPDILVSCDPTNYFPNDASINHPDHRAIGQAVVDGYFPAAGNPHYFPELLKAGLVPHSVKEIWLSLTANPNTVIDVTDLWETKIQALKQHTSQILDPIKLEERMRGRHTPESSPESPRYEEKFRRIIYMR